MSAGSWLISHSLRGLLPGRVLCSVASSEPVITVGRGAVNARGLPISYRLGELPLGVFFYV